jgi:hypothetical protein
MRLWSAHDIAFQHYRRYTSGRLMALWARQPVRVRLVSPFCSTLYWPIRAVRTVRNQIHRVVDSAKSDLGMPPAIINQPLRRLFSAEGDALERALDTGAAPFSHGSSLIAILERLDGTVTRRQKPEQFAADPHDPWPTKTT